jgi:YHS domain
MDQWAVYEALLSLGCGQLAAGHQLHPTNRIAFHAGLPGHQAAGFEYQRRTYHFCSRECRDPFASNPAQYLKAQTK